MKRIWLSLLAVPLIAVADYVEDFSSYRDGNDFEVKAKPETPHQSKIWSLQNAMVLFSTESPDPIKLTLQGKEYQMHSGGIQF